MTALLFVLCSFFVSSSIGLPFLSVNVGVSVSICSSTLASMFGSAFRLRRVALTHNGTAFGRGISSGQFITYFGERSGLGLGFIVFARAEIERYARTYSSSFSCFLFKNRTSLLNTMLYF